eukprot:scaffold161075_cov16-Tisochrysis_lutea.AAC.1
MLPVALTMPWSSKISEVTRDRRHCNKHVSTGWKESPFPGANRMIPSALASLAREAQTLPLFFVVQRITLYLFPFVLIAQDLTPADTVKIIEALRKGEEPKINSQYRNKAEPRGVIHDGKWVPSEGTVTLTTPPRGPFVSNPDFPSSRVTRVGLQPEADRLLLQGVLSESYALKCLSFPVQFTGGLSSWPTRHNLGL